ncbi:unnamed protein product, partial [Candidula unifasciata]
MADEEEGTCLPACWACAPVLVAVDGTKALLNRLCDGLEPWKILVYSSGTTLVVLYLKDFLFQEDETLTSRVKRQFFSLVKRIPAVKRQIEADMEKTTSTIEAAMIKNVKGEYVCKLPAKGLSENVLLEELAKYKSMTNDDWRKGLVSGTVYNGDDKLTELMAK